MSATLKNIYAATPSTTRGRPIHVGGDPKGKNWLYTCGNAVFIRDLKDPLKCEIYTEHAYATTVARYSPSGFYIASGDVSGTIRIWDTTQVEHILKIELKMLSGPVLDLQWSDDSKRIVAVGDGKEKYGVVFMFDSGSSVGEISGHSKVLSSCDFKQTRPYRLATGGEDLSVGWFEGPPFKFKKSIKDHQRFVNCVRFSPNGEKLLTVGSDKNGFLYDGKNGDPVGKLSADNAHSGGIYAASWSPDSKRFVTVSADKTAKIYDENGNCQQTFQFSENPQVEDQQVGCLWQGDEILTIALGGEIYYLDPSNPSKPKKVVRGHNKFVTSLAYDAASGSFISASYDALMLKWNAATGENEGFSGKGHSNQINKVAIQGGNVVSSALDDTIRITSLTGRTYSADAIKVSTPPADIAVGHKDTSLILAATMDSIVVIRNGQAVNTHAVKFQPASIALSVDETQVAVGGKDNNIYLFNLSGDKLTETDVLKEHRGAVSCVTYSPDGKYLASADWNRSVVVWDVASKSIKENGWVFHNARVNSLSWAANSVHLASAGLDGLIYVWNLEAPTKKVTIKDAHRGGVNVVCFVDANTLVSGGQDCTLKTWALNL